MIHYGTYRHLVNQDSYTVSRSVEPGAEARCRQGRTYWTVAPRETALRSAQRQFCCLFLAQQQPFTTANGAPERDRGYAQMSILVNIYDFF